DRGAVRSLRAAGRLSATAGDLAGAGRAPLVLPVFFGLRWRRSVVAGMGQRPSGTGRCRAAGTSGRMRCETGAWLTPSGSAPGEGLLDPFRSDRTDAAAV